MFNDNIPMKVINKNDDMDNLSIKNDLNILEKLCHPNNVRIYEFYEWENIYYLINEFYNGGGSFSIK